jgi:general secretion pathway protein L
MIPIPWVRGWAQADFLKAAGLYLAPDHLHLVRVRKDLFRLTVIAEEARQLGTDGSASSRRQALSEAFRSLLPHFDPAREPLYISLSADQTICIELFLPLVAQEDLRQALDYEIERQLPLRPEEVYYDFLPAGRKGEKLRVFLFAAPKKILDDLFDVLSAFKVRPRGVETSFTSLCTYFLSCTAGEEPSAVIIGGQKRGWEIVELRPGKNGRRFQPEIISSRWFPQGEWSQAAARELFSSSIRRSPRWFGWGYFADFLRLAEIDSLEIIDLLSLGERRFAGGRRLSHPSSLPAAGAALRGLREASFPVNLLPDARQEKKGGWLSWLNEALAVLFLLALILLGVSYPLRDEIRLRQLQRENRKLEPSVEALRREEDELASIRGEIALLSRLQGRRGEILQVLDELSRIVPDTAYLSAFRYRAAGIEIQGSAENASNLVPVLERSPFLRDVGFTAPSNRGRDNRETFSLKAELEQRRGEAVKP